jgi:hypothetical protein
MDETERLANELAESFGEIAGDGWLFGYDQGLEKLRAENAKLREAAQEVVWSWREATGHEDLPQCLMVSRAAVEGSIAGLEEALT